MSFCMEYMCPCGKKHKSRNTVSRHKKAEAQKSTLGHVPEDVPKDKKGHEKGQDRGSNPQVLVSANFLKEINLQGEFNKMEETVNPKKDKGEEKIYKCGSCSGTFKEKIKRCPHCGVEFE